MIGAVGGFSAGQFRAESGSSWRSVLVNQVWTLRTFPKKVTLSTEAPPHPGLSALREPAGRRDDGTAG